MDGQRELLAPSPKSSEHLRYEMLMDRIALLQTWIDAGTADDAVIYQVTLDKMKVEANRIAPADARQDDSSQVLTDTEDINNVPPWEKT